MALLVAAITALALVPAGAWATNTTGVLGGTGGTGTITISGTKANETYNVYRLFDLASFSDDDTGAAAHSTSEAYSYVIRETTDGTTANPWWTWLTTGGGSDYAAAIPANGDTSSPATRQLFWYESQKISVNGGNDYHVIRALDKYNTSWLSTYDVTSSNYSTTDYTTADWKDFQDFAKAALAYAESNGSGVTALSGTHNVDTDGTNITYENVPLGYYLLGTTSGTLASLDTANNDVTVYDKNEEPTITKAVANAGTGNIYDNTNWYEDVSADIGDTVWYRTEINAKQGAENYKLHDVMEAGLTFGEISRVTLTRGASVYTIDSTVSDTTSVYPVLGNSTSTPSTPAAAKTNYTLTTSGLSDGCDFEIAFASDFVVSDGAQTPKYYAADIKDGDTITVYYTATLNENAVVFGNPETNSSESAVTDTAGATISPQAKRDSNTDGRNTNSTVLTYGNKSFTTWEDAKVTTYQLDVVKTSGASAADTYPLLAGAKFKLYKATTNSPGGSPQTRSVGGTTYYLTSGALGFDSDSKYRYAGDGSTAATNPVIHPSGATVTTDIVSTDTGEVRVYGLDAGIYILEEVEAPAGYNKLAHPIVVTVVGDTDHDGLNSGDTGYNDTGTSGSDVLDSDEGTLSLAKMDNNNDSTATTTTAGWNANITSGNPNTYVSTDNGGVHIVNQTGPELPSTGGIGTTVFYVVGGILVAGSVVLLITKRRMASES